MKIRQLLSPIILMSCFGIVFETAAQDAQATAPIVTSYSEFEKWDVLNPPMVLKKVAISTNETTWSSLDITPNGKQFVFDMLGDIFIVDVYGGEAKPLTQDFAWNIHPAVSPDGKKIAFISDRDGLSNVWIMDINGENLKQVT